jgi:hypothetical protein
LALPSIGTWPQGSRGAHAEALAAVVPAAQARSLAFGPDGPCRLADGPERVGSGPQARPNLVGRFFSNLFLMPETIPGKFLEIH